MYYFKLRLQCHRDIFSINSKKVIVHLNITLKTEIILQLHIKMPVITLVIQIQFARHINIIIILTSTYNALLINKMSLISIAYFNDCVMRVYHECTST